MEDINEEQLDVVALPCIADYPRPGVEHRLEFVQDTRL